MVGRMGRGSGVIWESMRWTEFGWNRMKSDDIDPRMIWKAIRLGWEMMARNEKERYRNRMGRDGRSWDELRYTKNMHTPSLLYKIQRYPVYESWDCLYIL